MLNPPPSNSSIFPLEFLLAYQVVPKPRLKPRKILAFLNGFPQQPTKNVAFDDFEDNAGFWWFWRWHSGRCVFFSSQQPHKWISGIPMLQLSTLMAADSPTLIVDFSKVLQGCHPLWEGWSCKNLWLNRCFFPLPSLGASETTVFGGQSFHWFLVKSLRHF